MGKINVAIQIAGLAKSGKTNALLALALQGACFNYMEHALVLTDELFAGLDEDYVETRYDAALGIRVYVRKGYNLMVGIIEVPITIERLTVVLKELISTGTQADAITRLYLDLNTANTAGAVGLCFEILNDSEIALQAYTTNIFQNPLKHVPPLQITSVPLKA
jgi:hypothetical protein